MVFILLIMLFIGLALFMLTMLGTLGIPTIISVITVATFWLAFYKIVVWRMKDCI